MGTKLDVTHFNGQNYRILKKQLIEQKSVFTDMTFPADESSLGIQSAEILESIVWKRPKSICDSPVLFDSQSYSTKVQSGQFSCSRIVTAFCILSGIKELCYKIVFNYLDQEYDADKHSIGMFVFRFWRFGTWVEVVVDDCLPTIKGKLVYTHSLSISEFWVSLAEKAYAKLHGSYEALKEGSIADVLVDMTGGVSEVIDLRTKNMNSTEETLADFFQNLSVDMSLHSIMCVCLSGNAKDGGENRNELGLVRGHQYLITAVKKVHLEELSLRNLFMNREKVAVLRLRDVCHKKQKAGNSPKTNNDENNFVFSTSSLTRLLSKNPVWTKLKELDKDRLGLIVHHEGEFWMPFEDFVSNFDELTVVRMFNNNVFMTNRKWSEAVVKGSWKIENRTKYRKDGISESSSLFLRNPQYLLHVKDKEEEIVLQMLQWDGVESKEPQSSSSSSTVHHGLLVIGLYIIKVELNRKYRLHKLSQFCKVLLSANLVKKREVYHCVFFPRGNYLIVPATLKEESEGNFIIRALSHGSFHLSEVLLDRPKKTIKCFSRPYVWVTAISVQRACGLKPPKNIFFTMKCEKQIIKSQISKSNQETSWEDSYVFYRKKPGMPILIKVYRHYPFRKDKFIGFAELPASLNHSVSYYDVVLLSKKKTQMQGVTIGVQVLTEDNLFAI